MPTAIKTLYQRALRLCAKLHWIGPLAVRIVVGIGFAFTGWAKLNDLDTPTELFTKLHIPFPHANAVFVSCVEFAGGILVALGLGTRIAALFLTGVMAVALLTAIVPNADGLADLFTSIELTYLAIFLWLIVHGGGPISIDRLVSRRSQADHQVGEPA